MKIKKLLASILAVTMIFSMVGFTAAANGENVAEIGDSEYATLKDAIEAASADDVITVTGDITDENVTVDKSLTITAAEGAEVKPVLTDVSITAGEDVALSIKNIAFKGASYITVAGASALTVEGVDADVELKDVNTGNNSRNAFISLGSSEQTVLKLVVKDSTFLVSGDNNPDSILGWAQIADGTEISGNTFGAADSYLENRDAVKFMAIAEDAVITVSGNTVYSNYNGFVFGQNTTRDNAYTVVVTDNKFYGSADHIWVEVDGDTTTHATVKASSSNTVNDEAFTAADIKTSETTWTSYAGVDITTDEEGRVTGGTLADFSNKEVVAPGAVINENNEVVAPTIKIGEDGFATLAAAVTAANEAGTATITLEGDIVLGEKLTITGDVTIYGEYTITRDAAYTGTLFDVKANASLALDGGLTIDGGNDYTFNSELYEEDLAAWESYVAKADNAKWFAPEEDAPVATAYMITTSGTVNLNDVTVKNHYSTNGSGLVSAGKGAVVTLDGAQITHNASIAGSGLVVNASGGVWSRDEELITVTMEEGTVIDGNHVGGNHGIFKIYMGTYFTMNGGEIKNTTGWNSNGTAVGIYHAVFTMNGGSICSNSSVYGPNNGRNAAVYGHSNHLFIMNDGEICHNTGRSKAGVDSPYSETGYTGSTIINGGSATDNTVIGPWSVPDVSGGATLTITGGTFTQDVSQWLAPDSGLIYDEEAGSYTVTEDAVWEMHLTDANGEAHWLSPMSGSDLNEVLEYSKIWYDSLEGTYDFTLKLIANTKVDETAVIDFPLTIDLNGHTVYGGGTVNPVFRIVSDVTVTGNGGVDGAAAADSYAFILGASDGSAEGNLTIENGNYNAQTTVASVTKGTLTINGGEFEIDPYVASEDAEPNYDYLLNCIDKNYKDGSAVIVVNGGIFHDFNPADNAAEGKGTSFMAEGAQLVPYTDGRYGVIGKRTVTVEADEEELYAEETVDITVKVSGADFANAGWTIAYEADKFEYVSKTEINGDAQADDTETAGTIKGIVLGTSGKNEFKSGDVFATYTFKALAQDAEVTGSFKISETYVNTMENAALGDSVAADNNEKVDVTILLKKLTTAVTKDSETITLDADNKYTMADDGAKHTFAVSVTDGEYDKIEYSTDNGTTWTTEAPAFEGVGDYTVLYKVDAAAGYANDEGTFTVAITAPLYKIEVVNNGAKDTPDYVANYTMILVYTDIDGLYFSYGKAANVMYDVTAAGYKYTEYDKDGNVTSTDDTEYTHVYAVVVPAITDAADYEAKVAAYKANVSFTWEDVFDETTMTIDETLKEDVNASALVDINDVTAAYGVYNVNEYYVPSLMKLVLRADVNNDKIVDTDDISPVKTAAGLK